MGRGLAVPELPLKAQFAGRVPALLTGRQFELRFHVLDQTDFKLFSPNDRPRKSGLYIPRVRVYLEGRLPRLWEYEVSLQAALEGTWDLLDGSLNSAPRTPSRSSSAGSSSVQLRLVRSPRAILHRARAVALPAESRPLAPGRVMAWGKAREGRLDLAVGGFNGHLAGLAETPESEAVGT